MPWRARVARSQGAGRPLALLVGPGGGSADLPRRALRMEHVALTSSGMRAQGEVPGKCIGPLSLKVVSLAALGGPIRRLGAVRRAAGTRSSEHQAGMATHVWPARQAFLGVLASTQWCHLPWSFRYFRFCRSHANPADQLGTGATDTFPCARCNVR